MHKILIVEDDPMIAEIYQKKFSDSGFEVKMADSGEKALDIIKSEKVELILLDLVMPGMDGFELIENIKKNNLSPGVRLIVFSNLSQKEEKEKAMELGADGFIVKSDYAPNDLVKELERLMNQFDTQKKEGEVIKKEEKKESDGILGAKRILMMEDEDVFVDMFGGKLKQEGFNVECMRNGSLGIKEAMANQYDLFIIDMAMPIMNGDEVVERLKSDETLRDIPIIILSASFDSDLDKVKNLGVDKIFIKTQVTPSDLAKEIKEILNK